MMVFSDTRFHSWCLENSIKELFKSVSFFSNPRMTFPEKCEQFQDNGISLGRDQEDYYKQIIPV